MADFCKDGAGDAVAHPLMTPIGTSFATLRDVVRHYSEIDEVKLHIAASQPHPEMGEELPPRPAESVLRTLNLNEREIADLVAFLDSLTERRPLLHTPVAKVPGCP